MEKTNPYQGIQFLNGFLWGLLALSALLALLILVLPSSAFLAYSNYLQIITAFAGAIILMVLWNQSRDRKFLLWAGAGYLLWGLSNIGWYVNALLGLRSQSFPGIFDLGLVLSIFVMGCALFRGLPGEKIPAPAIAVLFVICLIVPAGIIVMSGINTAALATLAFFLSCGLLVAGGFDRSFCERPLLMLGTVLFALAFMIYPLREIYLVSNPLLSLIGPVVCAGFALIVLGLLPFAASSDRTT